MMRVTLELSVASYEVQDVAGWVAVALSHDMPMGAKIHSMTVEEE